MLLAVRMTLSSHSVVWATNHPVASRCDLPRLWFLARLWFLVVTGHHTLEQLIERLGIRPEHAGSPAQAGQAFLRASAGRERPRGAAKPGGRGRTRPAGDRRIPGSEPIQDGHDSREG